MQVAASNRLLDGQSMGASFESLPFRLNPDVRNVSIEITAPSNTHVGTFYVKHGNGEDTTKWQTVTTTPAAPSASNGAALASLIEFASSASYFLLGYTRVSGTGAATALVATKHAS